MNPSNVAWLVGALALTTPLTAFAAGPANGEYPACTKEVTQSDVAAAKGLFQAGQTSYQESDYAKAASYWEDAYERDCTAHALLLNLSRAYELAGDRKRAVLALKTYLEREPDSPRREQLTRRVEKLEARVAEEEASAPKAKPEEKEPKDKPDPKPAKPVKVEETPVEPPDLDSSGAGGGSVWPWVVVGVGGAVAVTGGVLYLTNSGTVSDLEDRCGGRECAVGNLGTDGSIITQQNLDDANSARTLVDVGSGLFWGGLAISAGGLLWYFLQPSGSSSGAADAPHQRAEGDKPDRFSAQLSPVLAPGFTGLNVTGRF